MSKTNKTIIAIIALVSVVVVSSITAIYSMRKNASPQIAYMLSTGQEGQNNFYIEARSVGGEIKDKDETNALQFSEKNFEIFQRMNREYVAPTEIYADCFVKNGKTYVHFYGTATEKETGNKINVDETLEFGFAFTKNIVQYSEADRVALKNETDY